MTSSTEKGVIRNNQQDNNDIVEKGRMGETDVWLGRLQEWKGREAGKMHEENEICIVLERDELVSQWNKGWIFSEMVLSGMKGK